jgi:hypothetical protein
MSENEVEKVIRKYLSNFHASRQIFDVFPWVSGQAFFSVKTGLRQGLGCEAAEP